MGNSTEALFRRFYFSQPWYFSGTQAFHKLIGDRVHDGSEILEVGAGPFNKTSEFLSTLGRVTGLDIDTSVDTNSALAEAKVFAGGCFPFPDCSFDVCISNYVLEHVDDVETHFCEVRRVLRPAGFYFFRTPNLWHYVTLSSRLLPHSIHLLLANRLLSAQRVRDPYPTFYRANTRATICGLAMQAKLAVLQLETIEPEPSYGAAHPALFYPMMAYERIVNRFTSLSGLRVNILGIVEKPASTPSRLAGVPRQKDPSQAPSP